jgi:hypothetical protein
VEESAFPSRGIVSLPLIANVVIGMIYTDNANRNRIVPSPSKFHYLIPQVINHTVDLLDHRLGKNFHFDPNLDRSDNSPGNAKALIKDRSFPGNDFSKGTVSASGSDAMPSILDV